MFGEIKIICRDSEGYFYNVHFIILLQKRILQFRVNIKIVSRVCLC